MSTPVSAFETGQVAFASSAALRKVALVDAGDLAGDGEDDAGQLEPAGRVRGERDVRLDVERLDVPPASPRTAENCMA